jgi:hypothetical protein
MALPALPVFNAGSAIFQSAFFHFHFLYFFKVSVGLENFYADINHGDSARFCSENGDWQIGG